MSAYKHVYRTSRSPSIHIVFGNEYRALCGFRPKWEWGRELSILPHAPTGKQFGDCESCWARFEASVTVAAS